MGILRFFRGIACLAALLAAGFWLTFPVSGHARAATPLQLQEQKIKAGLVYNFLKYTAWRGKEGDNIQVCIIGRDPFDGYLTPLQGKTAQQQSIHIIYLNENSAIESCHVGIIGEGINVALPALLNRLHSHNILTVSDIRGFTNQGGMIELSTGRDRRIHMYVNKGAIDAAGLEISERLLKLANHID